MKPHEITLMEKVITTLRDRVLIGILFHRGCCISEAPAVMGDAILVGTGRNGGTHDA